MCSPEAVNISNVAALVDSEGKPHFTYVVEGANLFFTQQARLYLEQRKVVLFKDSSANKGGVTSSSLEVLAGLALATDEYLDLMIFKDGKPSEFYKNYVKDIQEKISENAAAESHCLWKEHARLSGSKPRTVISDELSSTLNNLQAELESSDLFDDAPSRKGVMRKAIPKTLVDKVGLDELLKRLPEPYQRALFSSWVASRFVSLSFFHHFQGLSQLERVGNRFTSTVLMVPVLTFSTSPGSWHFSGDPVDNAFVIAKSNGIPPYLVFMLPPLPVKFS